MTARSIPDPHKWDHVGTYHSGMPGDGTEIIDWCKRCGAMRFRSDVGPYERLEQPTESKPCTN